MVCCCSLAGTAACDSCYNKYSNQISSITVNHITPEMYKMDYYINQNKNKKVVPKRNYQCPNCDAILTIYQKYCHNCAVELDWEDILND